MSAESYADLMERLFATYEESVGFGEIEQTVAACRRDLHGQVPPGAELELIERLARHRLDQRAAGSADTR